MSVGKVLIVDDDKIARDLVKDVLDLDGLYTCVAGDGYQAITSVERDAPDLVLLDLRLPGIDGFKVCKLIRRSSHVPIIAVSALKSLEERERFLSLGGDDYVTKPFTPEELIFRVRTALRKGKNEQPLAVPFQFGDGYLKIDFDAQLVKVAGKEVTLTMKESVILRELMRNAGKSLTHEYLLQEAWGAEYITDRNVLYLCISHIRSKIERDPPHPRYIVTQPCLGYRFGITPAGRQSSLRKPAENDPGSSSSGC